MDNKKKLYCAKKKPTVCRGLFCRKYLFFKRRYFSKDIREIRTKKDLVLLFSWDSYGFIGIEANSLL